MAAFLNKPSDFTVKSATTQEVVKLIPPSEFEKPRSAAGAWSEGRRDAGDVVALKLENHRLREKLHGYSMSDSQSDHPGVSHRSLPMDERRYADELISRQAEELSKLRSQVQRLEHEGQTMRDDFEHRLADVEREREDTVSALSDSLQRREEEHEEEISRLSREHKGEVSDLQARLQHLSTDLDHSKGQLTSHLTDLTEELRTAKKEAREREESLHQEIREKDAVLRSQAEQVQQLRTYITESEQKHQPHQVWIQQCETLTNKLKVAEAEKETLQSSVQLTEIRLSSMKEILNTQEAELSKGKEETIDKNKLKELLLTKWRQKVYAMLVQQKSAQIVSRKDLQNWKEKTEMLEDRLSSAHNTINILQHTVAEKDAEFQLAANSHKKVQEEVNQAEQVALCLDAQISKDNEAVQHLAAVAHSCEDQFNEKVSILQQALGQLKSLGQRVSFASSRMDILKSQLTRNKALKQLDEKEGETAPPDSESEETWRTEKEHLSQELLRVSGERDMLAAQLQQDSQTWADKFSSMRSHYDGEVSSLKKTVEDLELTNQDKSRNIDELREYLETEQSELSEMKERMEHLSTELARHHHTMEQALEEQRKEVEGAFTEQLADMERKLNEARREHTKAVVKLRQQDRQWGRERERSEELQTTTVAHYTKQLEHMHRELQAVEKERNIFMATLRQEGLLGKLKSERGEPMRLELQEEVAMKPDFQDSQTATEVTQTDSLQTTHDPSEPVSAVLEDLRYLVPAVMDDDDSLDSSDENQD
ncbi:coiled-coil alpha-helical rod protein 1-like [Littorina saxatilis]|uniref:Coiled-coil alpha-helical rod protein 1 n=1 Tax=Littorina saxatilis TaxID=31220 RepID=A0AAN9AXW1_9CAEN